MIGTYSQTTKWNRSSALTLSPYFGECIGLTTELTPQATVGLLLLLYLTLSFSTSSSTSSSGAETNCDHGSITIPKSNIRPRSNNQKQHLKPDKGKAREPRPRTQQRNTFRNHNERYEKQEEQEQRISELEQDLYTKRIEVQSMSDTIQRLNQKLKDLQKNDCVVSDKNISFNESVINELFSDVVDNVPSV